MVGEICYKPKSVTIPDVLKPQTRSGVSPVRSANVGLVGEKQFGFYCQPTSDDTNIKCSEDGILWRDKNKDKNLLQGYSEGSSLSNEIYHRFDDGEMLGVLLYSLENKDKKTKWTCILQPNGEITEYAKVEGEDKARISTLNIEQYKKSDDYISWTSDKVKETIDDLVYQQSPDGTTGKFIGLNVKA